MVELKDIEFSYRKKGTPALADVTATVHPGVHLLAGENGAGKTTLLHIIAGLSRPDKGECLIDGKPSFSGRPSEMGRTFMLEENMLLPGRSINEFAEMHSRFYPNFSREVFRSNLEAFGLTGNELSKSASTGNRKKAQLAYVLALGVDVLLLDEPTNALDIQSKMTLRKLLASCVAEDQTVIVATHTISELENLYDGSLMLTRSRLLFSGSVDAVSEKLSFVVTRVPQSEALYQEIQAGRVLSICPAIPDSDPTRVDWRLFYSALHSPRRGEITKALQQQ